MVDWHVPNWSLIKKTKWVEMTVEFARTVKAWSLINRIRQMVSLISAEKYRDDDFRLVRSVGQRKSSHEKSNLRSSDSALRCSITEPRGSITNFTNVLHTAGSAMSRSWQDEKHLSLFLYRAQNSLILFTNITLLTLLILIEMKWNTTRRFSGSFT